MGYKIVRHFYTPGRAKRTIRRGLTLQEAQDYCRDPETSSRTATSPQRRRYTARVGPWFDGYDVDYKRR